MEEKQTPNAGTKVPDSSELQELRTRQDAIEIMLSTGQRFSDEQIAAIAQLRRENPSLSRSETLALAGMRKPELFANAVAGGPPPSHFVQPPGRSTPPPTSSGPSMDDILKAMQTTRDTGNLDVLGASLVARLLAEHPDTYIEKQS